MMARDLLARVKENLIITFNDDDSLILGFITAAISYAESYQHLKALSLCRTLTEALKMQVLTVRR